MSSKVKILAAVMAIALLIPAAAVYAQEQLEQRVGGLDLTIVPNLINNCGDPCPDRLVTLKITNNTGSAITVDWTSAFVDGAADPDCVTGWEPTSESEVAIANGATYSKTVTVHFTGNCDGRSWIKFTAEDHANPDDHFAIRVLKVNCCPDIPTMTEWGALLLILVLIGSAVAVVRRRRRVVAN